MSLQKRQLYLIGTLTSRFKKRAYLLSLPHQTLVNLLLHAANTHPYLPIFTSSKPTLPTTPTLQANGASHHNGTNGEHTITAPAADGTEEEQEPAYYLDDPPAHYPQPGHGLARTLPPESEHLPWLLDDNTEVFSHVFPADEAPAAVADGVGMEVDGGGSL